MTGKRSSLTPGVRQAGITEYVGRRGSASVEELAAAFDASAETIRRDLSALAEAGRLRKVHGGARAVQTLVEGSFEERMNRNAPAKREIADKLRRLIEPHMTLLIDTGSTTVACSEVLSDISDLTVITNSFRNADVFAKGSGNASVLILGGRYAADNAQTVGAMTVSEISNFHADRVILTVAAINETGGMDFSVDEAQVARAMIAAADELIVVADSSKFNQRAPFRVCGLDQIATLVTNTPVPESLAEKAAAAGVGIV